MIKRRPTPQDSRPGDRTQVLGRDALSPALESSPETSAGQATTIIPAGLPMLEALPPLGEEPTQPIPRIQSGIARDPDAEVLAIVDGPDATVAMKAGAPTLPKDWGATHVFPTGEPAVPLGSTQILSTGLPEMPRATATQVMPAGTPAAPQDGPTETLVPDRRTIEVSSDLLPPPRRKGIPLWGWAGIAALVLGLTAGGLYFLRPDLLGMRNPDSTSPEATALDADRNPETTSAQALSKDPATPAPEVPPALRPYLEKAEKGDAASMRMLGVMYYNGLNVPKNEREGLRWYRKAADAGSKAAQKELKQMGVER